MVANASAPSIKPLAPPERFAPFPAELYDAGARVLHFTADDVEPILRAGLVPEDATTELLGGQIVLKDRAALGGDPDMIGDGHAACVELFSDLRGQVNAAGRHVRSQQPLRCSPHYVPEPDFAVVRGQIRDYLGGRPPTGTDAFCVVEISDSSYERDTGMKLAAYARAGVPQYVVVNLRDRTAEVREHPDREAGIYPPPLVVPADGTLSLRVGGAGEAFDVRLADVLP